MTELKLKISSHFLLSEWACKCAYVDCPRVVLHAALPYYMEVVRSRLYGNSPLTIVSGFRCRRHNADVGGVSNSEHCDGSANDIPARATLAEFRGLGLFSGLGVDVNGKVVHCDIRHLTLSNATHSTPQKPSIWYYDKNGKLVK